MLETRTVENPIKRWLVRIIVALFLCFSMIVLILQFHNSFRGYFLGPYGDDWAFARSITKVSFGVNVLNELFKFEGDYRHIFTKLIWAGNYLFANGTNLFTSVLVIFFLLMETFVLVRLLMLATTLSKEAKFTIFALFLLANFGGIAGASITIPVLATWPIVLSSLFIGAFFLLCAAQEATLNPQTFNVKMIGYLCIAHLFGVIALCTFGHGFLYFIFFFLVLWNYQQRIKTSILFSLPGAFFACLYIRHYQAGHAALDRLKDFQHVIFNLPYYFFRLLADPFYYLTANYALTATLGLFGFALLIFLIKPLVFKNKLALKPDALYAVLTGMLLFTLFGCMLGIFSRYIEVNSLYPSIPGRFAILVDTLWASAISLAIIRVSYKRQFFLTLIIIFGCALLFVRQWQCSCLSYRFEYFPNIVHVVQAMELHNGYVPELDIAQWANCNAVESSLRHRGVGGFAMKERLLIGLNISNDFTLSPQDKCNLTDTINPTVKAYDHLTDPGLAIYGKAKIHAKLALSSVILIANAKNNVIGFGFRSDEMVNRLGKSLGIIEYYAVAPWKNNEIYRSYLLSKDRESVCLLNDHIQVPHRNPLLLKHAIAPLKYTGSNNQYLVFLDFRMQVLPHFVAYYYVDRGNHVSEYANEKIPFDIRMSNTSDIYPETTNGGIAIDIPEKLSHQVMGHKIKVKILVKQSADAPTKLAGLRYDTVDQSGKLFTFTPQKHWQVVETTINVPVHKEGKDYLRIWADTTNHRGALLYRAAMIQILD